MVNSSAISPTLRARAIRSLRAQNWTEGDISRVLGFVTTADMRRLEQWLRDAEQGALKHG
jgi:hypothetical protein